MKNFDELPFEQNDNFDSESNDSMDAIPFEEIPAEEDKIETLMDDNNIIVLDERIKNIPKEEKNTEPTLDNNHLNIRPKN